MYLTSAFFLFALVGGSIRSEASATAAAPKPSKSLKDEPGPALANMKDRAAPAPTGKKSQEVATTDNEDDEIVEREDLVDRFAEAFIGMNSTQIKTSKLETCNTVQKCKKIWRQNGLHDLLREFLSYRDNEREDLARFLRDEYHVLVEIKRKLSSDSLDRYEVNFLYDVLRLWRRLQCI
ncbi:hypothetical protein COOONC_15666 [Cooperia oncophora]